MKKRCLGALMSAVVLVTASACSSGKNANQPCKTGAEACLCYANDTCDDELTCLAGLCLDLAGVGGAPFGQGGQPESGGAPDEVPEGGKDGGGSGKDGGGSAGSAGSVSNVGGSFSLGGSHAVGGGSSGGANAAARSSHRAPLAARRRASTRSMRSRATQPPNT
jgi:hypothetical protein